MTSSPLKLLFICTHNRCRSILCDAIANQNGQGVLLAKSGGSSPVGQVHPLTLKHLEKHGYDITGLTSDSWDDHEAFSADVVVTVCDQAAGERCPVWFGNSIKLHWGLHDPSKLADTPEAADAAFTEVIDIIKARTADLVAVAKTGVRGDELKAALLSIGASESA